MQTLEVFADVTCPFTHVALTRLVEQRSRLDRTAPLLHVRSWPLELVNGTPLEGNLVGSEVDALRRDVSPDLFSGFDSTRFPKTTRPALAAAVRAYRVGTAEGERCSLALRHALFEDGEDIGEPDVVHRILSDLGLPAAEDGDAEAVDADHAEGVRRGVQGSPHFFTASGSYFCPSLDIEHGDGGLTIRFDAAGFERFTADVFG